MNEGFPYKVEYITHEYLGGYKQADWSILLTNGECYRDRNGITVRFSSKALAETYLDALVTDLIDSCLLEGLYYVTWIHGDSWTESGPYKNYVDAIEVMCHLYNFGYRIVNVIFRYFKETD